jgi:lipopolysaccharide transport system permease protein
VIEPQHGWGLPNLREIWRYRELMLFLAWRDVKVRYKQTTLGAIWAILQPLAPMVVFSLSLGRIARDLHSVVPYPIFVYTGFLIWMTVANAMVSAGQSLIGNHNLVTKVFFPRLLIPMGAIIATGIDFAVGGVLLAALMFTFGLAGEMQLLPGPGLLLIPLIVLGLAMIMVGAGAFLSALTVAYRDFKHAVPFLVQVGMFATPAIYVQRTDVFGPVSRNLLLMNPVNGLIVNFRAAIFGSPFDWGALAASLIAGTVLLLLGGIYFRRVERTFADII